jgi:D-hexose-6-phosphate mutarotase
LNAQFGIDGQLSFRDDASGLVIAEISNPQATASLCLQGAHLMTWQPGSQSVPVVWLSRDAKLAAGKSIRGGVPVCWPWFGPHTANPQWPGHGFARTVPWQLIEATALPDGRTRLAFEIVQSEATRAQWPHPSTLRNTITVGQELEVQLATRNTGESAFELGQALHTYFQVGDVRRVTLHGLAGCEFIDKVEGGAHRRQEGPVAFSGETDRIYLGTAGCCEIRDAALQRSILVTASGSRSTVVWNPGREKADKMGDFGPDGHLGMVCVETANAAEDVITLRPDEEHVMAAQYRLLPA